MKVVLFCGGQGMRIRDYSESVPKPLIRIGYRPILWHVMKYYAHFGHRDFILCLGYKADVIKDYFLHYEETLSNDFVLNGGAKEIQLLHRDIDDWRITFVDTGTSSSIGERLLAVRRQIGYGQVTTGLCSTLGGVGGFGNPTVTMVDAAATSIGNCSSATCTITIKVARTSGPAALLSPITLQLSAY